MSLEFYFSNFNICHFVLFYLLYGVMPFVSSNSKLTYFLILFFKQWIFIVLFSFFGIPSSRPESGDHSLWADEEEVQSVQRDQKTSQPPDVRKLLFLSFFTVYKLQSMQTCMEHNAHRDYIC